MFACIETTHKPSLVHENRERIDLTPGLVRVVSFPLLYRLPYQG